MDKVVVLLALFTSPNFNSPNASDQFLFENSSVGVIARKCQSVWFSHSVGRVKGNSARKVGRNWARKVRKNLAKMICLALCPARTNSGMHFGPLKEECPSARPPENTMKNKRTGVFSK